ncbi:nucleolar pre-ribosomal-associated protein 1-like isoform X2 [Belonocnema kinseyi]|nr:nucleolar pre-ribosomal-associated protein 1-like isoform X2 [Belonocnema kinseyi]XP_033228124.1 nucleolar pre-ribosomal-associated protein 1-like isoform X2 [Belonocnema kinseyi]XP_033228125.1 nucleolar pre-ribosomal-associated protein 1-like isoform X2 [Belonocnema kinseyi]XP_033228126.1 nucleolar pre-ribosomal-associated protein 1-like isoform X2 [Belonocnema kinseyi]
MKNSKKKLTSNEDPEEPEIPPKKQKGLENCMTKLSIREENKKRKKSESKSTESSRICEKKKKIYENSCSNDEDSENETERTNKITPKDEKMEKSSKVEKIQLTGKALRDLFQFEHAFDAVRKFVTVCNENKKQDLAAEYLEAGGNVLEVLKTFDTTDKKNINNITTLFSAIHILIMKILGLYPEETEQYSNTEESCRRLINTHMSSIQSMLSNQSNAKQRKVVLKMLTTMVTIGGTLPRDILNNLSLNSQILEAVVRLTKPSDPNNVRTSFIHFTLAFLVDGRNNVIRSLLEKRDVLACIFPDLIYDSHETVHLILTTVKKCVLENSAVSKTTKLHIFSTSVVQNLVNLYNWKGPRNWPGLKKEKEKKDEKVDPEEKEIAVEAVHEFLITLLASKKYGIIFQDRSLGIGEGRKNNQLVNTVLKSLESPWEHEKPKDLVVQILRACPDLIKSQINLTEPLLAPKVSIKWIKLIRFLNQIIESLDIERFFHDSQNVLGTQVEQFANILINLTLPTLVLRKAVAPGLLQSNLAVRHESVLLFTTMLTQAKKLIILAENSFDYTKFRAFNNYLIEYMSDNAPVFERCLRTWKNALEPKEFEMDEVEIPRMEEVLFSILNLLKAYNQSFPALVYVNVEADVNLTMLLSGLSQNLDIQENSQCELNVIAIDFILSVNPFIFTPAQELYGKALLFLLIALDENCPLLDNIKSSITKLLEVPRAFYECEDQIEIWFNAFLALKDFEERLELALWFVKMVEKVFKHVDKYHLAIKIAEESSGIEIDKYMSFFEELKTNGAYYIKTHERLQYVTSLPIILCSALDSLKKKATENQIRFMNEILMHTLYYQVKPEPLIHLTKDIKELRLEEYM